MIGLGFDSPEGLGVSGGLIIGTIPAKRNKCIYGATSEGLLVQADVNAKGPKLSIGHAAYNPGIGYALKASVLHLWTEAGASPAGGSHHRRRNRCPI